MGGIGYSAFGGAGLISLGVYNLVSAIYTYLKSHATYTARPYYPFPPSSTPSPQNPTSSSATANHTTNINNNSSSSNSSSSKPSIVTLIKQQGVLYLVIAWLVIAILHQALSAADSDPLLQGRTPVHRFSALQSSAVLLLFLLLPLSLLLLPSSFDPRLFFALLAAAFLLQSSASSSSASFQTSVLQAHLSSLSARVSALSSLLSLSLAFNPRLFASEVGLWASLLLQGLWSLQSGLSLYVDAFIPDGCHRLLDVPPGVDGSTKCDLEDSRLRALAILDLLFVLHVLLVFLLILAVYAAVAKDVSVGTATRSRMGSYEALPTSDSASNTSHSIQMKTLTGTQA